MGTPEFAVPALDALHSFTNIVAVYTQPDRPAGRGHALKAPPVKARALELGLEVLQPERLSSAGEPERIRDLNPDLILVVAYGQILRQEVLDIPRLGCVNIHSSLLPRWRGAAPIHWAMLAGDAETGVTTQRMALKLDSGDLLLQARTPIDPDETVTQLYDRLARMGAGLVRPTLEGLATGELKGRPQDESAVTQASKLTKEMEALDGRLTAEETYRRIRALNPWPGTSVRIPQIGRLRLRSARRVPGHLPGMDGLAQKGHLDVRDAALLLVCVDGCLEVLELQLEGKRAQSAVEFLNGLRGQGVELPLALEPAPWEA
ncbi:MAG: methionyl-tRNA formyltransferase [Bdellovibrionales bacterium]|nr:methionyl-tRNA formyltransferase [Bdellovibrionales bacterium]